MEDLEDLLSPGDFLNPKWKLDELVEALSSEIEAHQRSLV